MKRTNILSFALVVGMLLAHGISEHPALAEMYLGGGLGVNLPGELKNIEGIGDSSGFSASDVKLKNSLAGGVKIGGYFPAPLNWFGLEGEIYHATPDVKAQPIDFSGSGFTASGALSKTNLHMTTLAVNALARYPGELIEPYGGVGIGVNAAYTKGSDDLDKDVGVGPSLNLLGGVRVFVTEGLALFAEYKYNRGKLYFRNNEFKADYSTNLVLGGVTYHFR